MIARNSDKKNAKTMQPYKFEPYFKTTVWGGYRMAPFKGICTTQPNIGEPWKISGVPGHESINVERGLVNDANVVLKLTGLIEKYGDLLVDENAYRTYGDKFPLLVKFMGSRLNWTKTIIMKRNICGLVAMLLVWQGLAAQDGLVENAVRNLPLLAPVGMEIHYQGSIDKTGGNADWDWFLYEDANHEWVVLDVDGPGCIQNITQHRYLTCSDPLFRFYIDGSDIPQYEVRLSELGLKFPFSKPFADSYIGPYDNGRGPIRVARSFVPLPFNRSCKVTTDVRLSGNDRMRGESGWGHVLYHTFAYPQSDTIKAYTENLENIRHLKSRGFSVSGTSASDTVVIQRTELQPDEKCLLASLDMSGVVSAVRLFADRIDAETMQTVWMEITFDGHDKPDVLCPIGAFFGNSLAYNSVEYLLMGVTEGGMMYNTFPMPFWNSVTLRLHNRGANPFNLAGGVVVSHDNGYPMRHQAIFVIHLIINVGMWKVRTAVWHMPMVAVKWLRHMSHAGLNAPT